MARVGFVVGDMFEESELRIPLERVRGAGHEVVIVGADAHREVVGKGGRERVTVDEAADEVDADGFDALVIPGGYSPDHLRTDEGVVGLVEEMFAAGKLVAAVCHGPSLLVDADVLDDRTVTSWPSIRNDLINAGATWVDRDVVEDGNLLTSRNPGDLEAFSAAILERLAYPSVDHESNRAAAVRAAREAEEGDGLRLDIDQPTR